MFRSVLEGSANTFHPQLSNGRRASSDTPDDYMAVLLSFFAWHTRAHIHLHKVTPRLQRYPTYCTVQTDQLTSRRCPKAWQSRKAPAVQITPPAALRGTRVSLDTGQKALTWLHL